MIPDIRFLFPVYINYTIDIQTTCMMIRKILNLFGIQVIQKLIQLIKTLTLIEHSLAK